MAPDRLDQRILKHIPDTHSISFTKCSQVVNFLIEFKFQWKRTITTTSIWTYSNLICWFISEFLFKCCTFFMQAIQNNRKLKLVKHLVRSVDCVLQSYLNLNIFENFTSLRSIAVHDCIIQQLLPSVSNSLQSVHVLNLSRNYLWNWNEICLALNELPSLQIVDLSHNQLSKLSDNVQCVIKLQHLNLSFNQVSYCQLHLIYGARLLS